MFCIRKHKFKMRFRENKFDEKLSDQSNFNIRYALYKNIERSLVL